MYMTWNCKFECTNDPMVNRIRLLPSTRVQPVRMMFGVFSIVPNANIDSNNLHDCVK